MSIKICRKCKKEFPETTDYFYASKQGKNGLYSICKTCKNEESKKYNRWEKAKHKYDLICYWCNKPYKGSKNNQKFCSKLCQTEWQRNSKEYKEMVQNRKKRIKFINQYGDIETREKRFKKEFEDKFIEFSYHSEFKTIDESFVGECKTCGTTRNIHAQCVRKSSPYKKLKCVTCEEPERERNKVRRMIKQQQRVLDQKVDKLIRNSIIQTTREIRSKLNKVDLIKQCIECNNEFTTNYKPKTKCDECIRHLKNKRKEQKRLYRTKGSSAISLADLIKRDNNICHICKKKCNDKDYKRNKRNHFIVGKTYPSIDHVKPTSKGGTDTLDNIKLAHHHCNSIKSDKEIYVNNNNQLTFSL